MTIIVKKIREKFALKRKEKRNIFSYIQNNNMGQLIYKFIQNKLFCMNYSINHFVLDFAILKIN